MSSEDFDDAVEEEMAALEAILMEDVTVLRGENGCITGVEVCVVPATAQQVSQQHVRCTLVVTFPAEYPSVQPKVLIRNPRGIDDSVLLKVEQEMALKCQECEGSPVVYELVELVRENLTKNNTPSCPCTICLYHFHPSDHFTKTHCFHYFHKHCMGRYVKNCELTHAAAVAEQQLAPWQPQPQLQLICPVCREPISVEESVESLLSCPGPAEEENEEQWRPDAPEVLALRRSMAKLFLQQQQRGGIIDLEHEKNKYFVSLMANESNIERVSVEESPTEESLENDKKDLTPPRDRSTERQVENGPADNQSTCPDAVVDGVDSGSSDRAGSSRVIGQDRFQNRRREDQSHVDSRVHGRENQSRRDMRDRGDQPRREEEELQSYHNGRDDQPGSRGRRGRSWYGGRGRGDRSHVQEGFGRGRRGGSDHPRSRGDHGRGGRGRGGEAVRGPRNMGDAPPYARSREERLGEGSYGRRGEEDEFGYGSARQFNRGGYGASMGRPYSNSRYAPNSHQHYHPHHHYNSMADSAGENCYSRFSGRGKNPPRFSKSAVPKSGAAADDANDRSSASTSQS